MSKYIVKNESVDPNSRRRVRLEREGDPTCFLEYLIPIAEEFPFRVGQTVILTVEATDEL